MAKWGRLRAKASHNCMKGQGLLKMLKMHCIQYNLYVIKIIFVKYNEIMLKIAIFLGGLKGRFQQVFLNGDGSVLNGDIVEVMGTCVISVKIHCFMDVQHFRKLKVTIANPKQRLLLIKLTVVQLLLVLIFVVKVTFI